MPIREQPGKQHPSDGEHDVSSSHSAANSTPVGCLVAAAVAWSTTANGRLTAITGSTRHRLLVGVRWCRTTAIAAAAAPMTARLPVSDGNA